MIFQNWRNRLDIGMMEDCRNFFMWHNDKVNLYS